MTVEEKPSVEQTFLVQRAVDEIPPDREVCVNTGSTEKAMLVNGSKSDASDKVPPFHTAD